MKKLQSGLFVLACFALLCGANLSAATLPVQTDLVAGQNLVVVGAAVVVGADGDAGGHVALPHHDGGDQK